MRERLLPPGEHRFSYRGLRVDGREANGEAVLTMPENAYFLVGLAETTLGWGLREGDLKQAGSTPSTPTSSMPMAGRRSTSRARSRARPW